MTDPLTAWDYADDTRTRIVDLAARLLQEGGPAAVTTRGVAHAAGVQAPAIYRLFGDKDGLLDAVAEHVMATFVSAKSVVVEAASRDDVDPLDDLRDGWQTQIEFGIANPTLFALLSAPGRAESPAAQAGLKVLQTRVRRVAAAGRLRVSEQRAVDLIRAAGSGAIVVLVSTPADRRDPGLADEIFEAVLRQIVTDVPGRSESGLITASVTFRAHTSELTMLTEAERQLLAEWVDRAITGLSQVEQDS